MGRPGVGVLARVVAIAVGWLMGGGGVGWAAGAQPAEPAAERQLAGEVHALGWVGYGARSAAGDWDLYLCRPDGSDQRPLTRTPEWSESAPQFSRDGSRLLYRRVPVTEQLDNNRHGEQGELVVAAADGTDPVVLGGPGELPWASFSPDGTEIASLSIRGIAFFNLERRAVVRTLPRKGFFQQMTWSPDGKWLCGVANSLGASWSVGRMDAVTGEMGAVNRVDCCTPDWFPDGRDIIFSWRPPGQELNAGYGWTQLWRATADGASRQLVYAEEGRHVYGGHISPDGRYVLFTGNVEEDGDPGRAGAPMGLMRLSDAPIIRGGNIQLRGQVPNAGTGPVLVLPAGWEPCWTLADVGGAAGVLPTRSGLPAAVDSSAELAAELHSAGWIVFSAWTTDGDWDLFAIRPDGSDRRRLTHTREFNEAGARFSPGGDRLLYYRMPRSEAVDNNTYGTFDLVVAEADGREPVVLGSGYSWASWGPDGREIACLAPAGIRIVNLATRALVREFPRRGVVSQLGWSPDGQRFTGTANGLGPFWNIGCLTLDGGEIHAVSETDRYNCTPDWAPDAQRIVYARGIVPEVGGRAELWVASADGKRRQPLYVEAERHVYGACVSPDGRYLLFTRSVEDLGKVEHAGTTMAIIRWSDTPMVGEEDPALGQRFPKAKRGPRVDLGSGWEPHWTAHEMGR